MATINPKIKINGSTIDEPFVKFIQNYEWTSSNYCLSVEQGYTNLNGLIINGSTNMNNIYTSNINQNIAFNVSGSGNILFKTSDIEQFRIQSNGNIGIGISTPNYKLDINGSLNVKTIYKNNIDFDNIYLFSENNYFNYDNISSIYIEPRCNIANFGIGITNPFGNLHIGSPWIANSDGTLIISKQTSSSINRNFKMGYDANYNFILGDFGNNNNTRTWIPQFYINSNAPMNSLVIMGNGNIGINTNITSSDKLTIAGSVNATSFTGVGSNLTLLNYNNITLNQPNLSNLNNWIYDASTNNTYTTKSLTYSIGTLTNPFNHKLHIDGSINANNIFVNNANLNTIYLSLAAASSTYYTKTETDTRYGGIWIKINDAVSFGSGVTNISIGSSDSRYINNTVFNAYGTVYGTKFIGNGNGITNISVNNIIDMPSYLTLNTAIQSFYTKSEINNTYYDKIIADTQKLYPSKLQFDTLKIDVDGIYAGAVTDGIIQTIALGLQANQIAIYHCNLLDLPYDYNRTYDNFGFGLLADTTNKINVNGILAASTIKSRGNIFENNVILSNIYISSNNYAIDIAYYDTINNRIKSQLTPLQLYPPIISTYQHTYSNIISDASYGNGIYILEASSRILNNMVNLSETYAVSNIFNTATDIPEWTTGQSPFSGKYLTLNNYIIDNTIIYNNSVSNDILATKLKVINNATETINGHWIQLYYNERFILSKLDIIIITANIASAPKIVTLIATNDNVDINNVNYAEGYNWVKLLSSVVIPTTSYISMNDSLRSYYSVSIPTNITPYLYYRLIITHTQTSEQLRIKQLRLYGYEVKREWKHSGTNIYSYSNISIGTINDLSPYKLNVNGLIYSSSNIYAQSNIGIGITSPFGNLHIGSPYTTTDGTIIISKRTVNSSNRNFKFGYDDNFNFIMGDFGDSNNNRTWKPQFYINSNAPINSLMINNYGNIGINTNNTSIEQKLYINGNSIINGCLNQIGNIYASNTFNNDIYASNNVKIFSNLDVSTIICSNYVNMYGLLTAMGNIGIGTSTNLKASLHIQSLSNNIGIWNTSTLLNTGDKISSFIGKNSNYKNGIYNYYYHSGDVSNNNYISWATCNIITLTDPIPDILCITANKNIGIGITNPTSIFQIGNGGKFKIGKIDNDDALIGILDIDSPLNTKIKFNGSLKTIEYYTPSSGSHIFYTSTVERLIINNNGNIGIGTNDTSSYLLNINGPLYSSSNIYAQSNIGIGITAPFGNLHIGTPYIISDGTMVMSKRIVNSSNRNFKFGYDDNFNFIMGDFGDSNANRIWKKQFYINSNAPDISLLINSNGNIGVGNSMPFGNLHIGSPIINSDGSLIISKKISNSSNRNFKFGYDDNFNFIMGDFGDSNNNRTWVPQFYINSNAPMNSLIINNLGNVGINTNYISPLSEKLYVNGNTTITGLITQATTTGNNIFNGKVGIGTNNSISCNLNVNGTANISSLLSTFNIINTNQILLQGKVKIGPTVDDSSGDLEGSSNLYVKTNTCFAYSSIMFYNCTVSHEVGNLILNSSVVRIKNDTFFSSKLSTIGNVGIGTATNINNILQIGDGGRLRISNGPTDYSIIGTMDSDISISNTRIKLIGSSYFPTDIKGNIEFYSTGKYLFYNNSSSQIESVRIDSSGNVAIGTTDSQLYKLNVNGKTNINGDLYSTGQIKEQSQYLSDIYVKLDNLDSLTSNNMNLNKKKGYICATSNTVFYSLNSINYYKYDIYLPSKITTLTRTVNSSTVQYRIFNIKCFLSDGIFENFISSVPNILQYDVYMSLNPLTPANIVNPILNINSGINICAIGTPENYKLSNILPSYITLLRNESFDYLTVISTSGNLSISYIIEDYIS